MFIPNIDAYSFPLILPQNSLRTKQHFFIALQDSDDLKTEEKKERSQHRHSQQDEYLEANMQLDPCNLEGTQPHGKEKPHCHIAYTPQWSPEKIRIVAQYENTVLPYTVLQNDVIL